MADPRDVAVAADDERAGDALLARGLHPARGHRTIGVVGDAVSHLVALLGDEGAQVLDARIRLAFLGRLLAARQAEEDDVGMRLLQFVEVRDARDARPAPRRPELDHVHFSGLETVDLRALDPLLEAE